jgi:hypothetical protein
MECNPMEQEPEFNSESVYEKVDVAQLIANNSDPTTLNLSAQGLTGADLIIVADTLRNNTVNNNVVNNSL